MKLTLNKLFSYLENDGIFNYLDQYDVPWKSSIDTDILNLDYHTKNGEKVIGPAVKALLTEDGLDTTAKQKLAKLIFYKNQVKWDELWRSQDIYDDFDVLDNVNEIRDETTIHTGSDSKTQNIGAKQNTFTEGQQIDSFSKGAQSNSMTKGEETLTEGAQSNTIGTHTDSKTITKSAYNSANYSPDTKEEDVVGAHTDSYGQKVNTNSSRSDSQTEGSREDSTTKGQRIDTSQEGAQQNTETGTDTYTDTYAVRRHGNIGVTTSGQLIRDFRQTVDFSIFETVYNDINEILVLNVYGDSLTDFEDYTIETNYHLPIASAQRLGGIKVGQNLTIASDGTLNAQGGGAVDSVNGQTGEVTLDASDVGAASESDLASLSDIVDSQGNAISSQGQAIQNIRQVPDGGNVQDVLRRVASGYMWTGVNEVPSDGQEGQVLTKGESGYEWADPSGGGDIPSYDSTKAGRVLKVNNDGDGLVWAVLRDLPVIYAAVAGKILSNNGSVAQWVNAPLQTPIPKSKMHLLQGYISTPTSGANQGLSVWNVESRGITLLIDVQDYEGQFLSVVFTSKTNKMNRYIAGRFTKIWNELQSVPSWTDTLPIIWNSTESGQLYYPATGAAAGWAGGNSHSWQSGYCNDYKNIYIPSGCKTIGFFYSWDLGATIQDLSDLVIKAFVETESPTT